MNKSEIEQPLLPAKMSDNGALLIEPESEEQYIYGKKISSAQKELLQKSHLTAAYLNFVDRLTTKYLISDNIKNAEEIEKKLGMKAGNTTRLQWETFQCTSYSLAFLLCLPVCYYSTRCKFVVEANNFALVASESGDSRVTEIYGPGFHVLGRYFELLGIYSFRNKYPNDLIVSPVGDLQIAIVDQGTIMHFELGGQNIILGPGVHKITEPMQFIKNYSLDSFYIEIGPEKWVTIPDGYDGVSVNLGEIQILEGGRQHHLSHIGDKFTKMVPKTLLTDRIPTDIPGYIRTLSPGQQKNPSSNDFSDPCLFLHTTTAEGSSVALEAMVFWKIVDTLTAAKNAMEILVVEEDANKITNPNQKSDQDYHIREASANINYLRQTCLRIIKHYLTAQVGECSLASDFSLGVAIKQDRDFKTKKPIGFENEKILNDPKIADHEKQKQKHSFDMLTVLQGRQNYLVNIINKELFPIGVKVENICIYCVKPSADIQRELDKQTKARVDANTNIIEANAVQQRVQIETQINNSKILFDTEAQSRAAEIQAEAEAYSERIRADGEAESIRVIAKARKEEADQLNSQEIAGDLARMRVVAEAGKKIFGGQKTTSTVYSKSPGEVMFQMINPNLGN